MPPRCDDCGFCCSDCKCSEATKKARRQRIEAEKRGYRDGLLKAARMAIARAAAGNRMGLAGCSDAYLELASDLRKLAKAVGRE